MNDASEYGFGFWLKFMMRVPARMNDGLTD